LFSYLSVNFSRKKGGPGLLFKPGLSVTRETREGEKSAWFRSHYVSFEKEKKRKKGKTETRRVDVS